MPKGTLQPSSRMCFICGVENPVGLKLRIYEIEPGMVESRYTAPPHFQGYPGILHGGIIATLLDAAMTNCLFAHGFVCLTGELKVRYYHPVNIGKAAHTHAWLERSAHRLHYLRAELEQDGVIKAAASSKFLETDTAIRRDDSGGAQAAGGGPQK